MPPDESDRSCARTTRQYLYPQYYADAAADYATPADLLAKIGRNADTKLAEKAESWDALNELWLQGSKGPLGNAGLSIKERK